MSGDLQQGAIRVVGNLVGGREVPAASGSTLDDVAPATGEVIATIPRSGAADVDAAVAAAAEAAPAWGRRAASERADLLEAIADGIEARQDELAALESRDTGKPVWLARTVDIPRAISNFRFFASAVRQDSAACFSTPGVLNYTLRQPLGVVGLITPWNLPLYLLSWKTAPALAMGNTVVAKPSEVTPLTAAAMGAIIGDVGVPPGVVNIVHGLGGEVGAPLVEHPRVKAVSFTGGTATGALVAAAGAPRFKKLSLELGGKNPSIVFADADRERALVGVLRASFANQGQVCLCGSRVLVERSIFSEFVGQLVARAREMKVGDPADPETRVGSLVSRAHREKVEGYIALALEEGGQILCGGKRPELPPPFDRGAFLEPTVIGGLGSDCRTATEEIFGPVITVHPFDDEADAVTQANGVRYGLCASVWTSDLDRAHRVSARLETGMVWVNTWLLRDLRVPFGGTKDSGVGREGGRYSLDFFSEDKNVCIELAPEER